MKRRCPQCRNKWDDTLAPQTNDLVGVAGGVLLMIIACAFIRFVGGGA